MSTPHPGLRCPICHEPAMSHAAKVALHWWTAAGCRSCGRLLSASPPGWADVLVFALGFACAVASVELLHRTWPWLHLTRWGHALAWSAAAAVALKDHLRRPLRLADVQPWLNDGA